METAKIANKLINGIKKAQVDLEEFQLQLAFGKSEAKDKYEDTKKKFNRLIHDTKQKVNEVKGKKAEIQIRLEALQVQLALGKAETLDAFNEQKIRITRALNNLEKSLKENKFTTEVQTKLQHEIEKFRIKLDILRLHFELGKLDIKDEFEEKKTDFLKQLQKIKDKISESSKFPIKKSEHFQTEIKAAYRHLKKAFA